MPIPASRSEQLSWEPCRGSLSSGIPIPAPSPGQMCPWLFAASPPGLCSPQLETFAAPLVHPPSPVHTSSLQAVPRANGLAAAFSRSHPHCLGNIFMFSPNPKHRGKQNKTKKNTKKPQKTLSPTQCVQTDVPGLKFTTKSCILSQILCLKLFQADPCSEWCLSNHSSTSEQCQTLLSTAWSC